MTGRMSETAAPAPLSPSGWMLRQWRETRGLSQLALALEAGVSARHLSFVETGRSEPSRELLLRLAAALGMGPRDRNALLSAAGYRPIHREGGWDGPGSAELTAAVHLLLRQAEPFAAAAVDRDHHIVMMNEGFAGFWALISGRVPPVPYALLPAPRLDILAMVFDPAYGLRDVIVNWAEVARWVLTMTRAELAGSRDRRAMTRFTELLRFPGVAELLHSTEPPRHAVVLPMQLDLGGQRLSFFSTITTLGSALDVTASELRIETWHPADAATATFVRGG